MLILGALCCDGLVGGLQDRAKAIMKDQNVRATQWDLMFWTNFYQACVALLMAVLTRHLVDGLKFCRAHKPVAKNILGFACFAALGQVAIFSTMKHFNSATVTAITTTRKLITVLLSLLDGGKKSLPLEGWVGVSIASVGIVGEAV